MTYNLFDSQEANISLQNRLLIPPVVLNDKIFFISNPKFFLVLYKIGKLSDFMNFAEIYGYDEIKLWLRRNHLLDIDFLDNISLYSIFCKIKYSCKMKFYVKNPSAQVGKFDLN